MTESPSSSEGGGKSSLLSQLQHFNKKSLNKTDTAIKTEDGKIIREFRDDSGNCRTEVTNKKQYGFVPDVLMDFQVGEIRDNLIFGSQDVAAEWGILERYGVTHIVNIGTYVKNYFENKVKYLNVKVNDTPDTKVLGHFDRTFKFIDEGRQDGCVFIHCNAGVSRASAFTIGYLMKTENMTFKDAFAYVKSKRPSAKPNVGFVEQLTEYEKTLDLSKE
ncbi:dual specificity protein phosphatase 19-like [Mercenaria mercenaria]|uniref:dual specificity protein phosphatase 19-like n=1 Tax=Mercenaria mercenaria TaxID=6596 RepID=UPI00234EB8D2|nr:dual specificity protein phosphatase 19-like [Mercenaria mercenaria]